MLHELLLALSGLGSPLHAYQVTELHQGHSEPSLLTPPEHAMQKRIARLGSIEADVRQSAEEVSSQHSSSICRAVASAILAVHLARFHRKICSVERDILQGDPALMGAYDAVPLTGILASLEKWYYVLAWLKELLLYIQLGFGPAGKLEGRRSGAQLIEFLRQASRTGHPDLERLAQNLAAVADSTWLR